MIPCDSNISMAISDETDMTLFTLQELVEITGGRRLLGQVLDSKGPTIRRLCTDSRQIQDGDCYFALSGERFDGHQFVRQALDAGACGAVIQSTQWPALEQEVLSSPDGHERALKGRLSIIGVPDPLRAFQDAASYHRSRFDIPVVAVTGSNGKTTNKEMTAQVLGQRWEVLKTEGNFNNRIGVPKTLLRLNSTHQAAVIEMGVDQQKQTTRLCEIARPTIGVITNIGPDHLEFFGSLEGSAQAKAELVDWMPSQGAVVLNADDPYYEELASRARCRVVSFGLSAKAQIRAENVSSEGTRGVTFRLILPDRSRDPLVRLRTHGVHNISNALAAAAVGYLLGVTGPMIAKGLGAFRPTAMRSEVFRREGVDIIQDCYNANPASMKAAIDVLAELGQEKRTVAILGDMLELGPGTDAFHREIGIYLAKANISLLLAVGSLGQRIAEGALAGGMASSGVFSVGNAKEAKQMFVQLVQPGDVALIKGSRGMRLEEILESES